MTTADATYSSHEACWNGSRHSRTPSSSTTTRSEPRTPTNSESAADSECSDTADGMMVATGTPSDEKPDVPATLPAETNAVYETDAAGAVDSRTISLVSSWTWSASIRWFWS